MTARALLLVPLLSLAVLVAGCRKDGTPAPHPPDARPPSVTAAAHKPALCGHGVPSDQCTTCNPALAEAFKELGDWCEEHALPESHCRKCNPGLRFDTAAAPADWCREHAVPESKCTKCNPALITTFIAAGDYCRDHGLPASVCPYCHPELVKAAGQQPPQFPAAGTNVRLASDDTARDSGIRTVRAEKRTVTRTLDVVGQIAFNQKRTAQLAARGDALVMDVKVDVGEDVRAGQPLVTLTSAAVGGSQAHLAAAATRLETARTALAREQRLADKGVSARKEAEAAAREVAAAEAEYDSTRASLAVAGASSAKPAVAGRYVLVAPFGGTVVSRDALAGKAVAAGHTLLEISDLTTMWVDLEIPETDARLVAPNQPVTLTFEGSSSPPIEARIARVGAMVDARTRTVRARIELPNADRALKAGTFVRAKVRVSEPRQATMVPASAIQETREGVVVFVKRSSTHYVPVAVTTGVRVDGAVEVTTPLPANAEVVTTGAFLLKTEILKDSIGAGCCDEGQE